MSARPTDTSGGDERPVGVTNIKMVRTHATGYGCQMSDIDEVVDYDPGEESGAAAGVISGDEEIGEEMVGGSTYGAEDLEDDEDGENDEDAESA